MLVQIRYSDNRFDYVKENVLHGLIESRQIEGFRRSSGWATIGVDPLRQFERNFERNFDHKPVIDVKNIIQVEYNDHRYDYVAEEILNTLIESKQIIKFKRITGWVTVGVDHLRETNRTHTYRYPNEDKKRAV